MLPLNRSRSRSRFFPVGVPSAPTDPFWSDVSLLLNTTSTNGAQNNTFLDSSANAFSVTRNGNTTQGTFNPFPPSAGAAWSASTNGGSGYFDGAGDYLSAAGNTAFDFGTGDFTVEAWVYLPATQTQFAVIACQASTGNAWYLSFGTGNTVTFSNYATSYITSSSAVSNNTWSHVAVSRSGTSLKMFINGAEVGSATNSVSLGVTANLFVGFNSATQYFNGYLSNFRIVKGTAVYTANFTPPTAPLTAITNTSLLLNFTNAGIYDSAAKNDLETVGNAQVSTTQAKWGATSMAFDGTGDWLPVIDKPVLRFGTGAFTVEGWLYLGATGAARGIVGKGTSTTGWLLSTDASDKVVFTYGTSTIVSTGALSGSTWYYIAVVREGTGANQTKIYINGTNDGTGTVSTDFNQTSIMYVGANRTGGDALNGYIDDLRITNGVARYTGNFTPPTAAFPLN